MGGDPPKCNQWWKYSFHKEKWHKIKNYRALEFFLDHLVQYGHLKKYVDLEKPGKRKSMSSLTLDLTEAMKKPMIPWRKTFLWWLFTWSRDQITLILRIRFGGDLHSLSNEQSSLSPASGKKVRQGQFESGKSNNPQCMSCFPRVGDRVCYG